MTIWSVAVPTTPQPQASPRVPPSTPPGGNGRQLGQGLQAQGLTICVLQPHMPPCKGYTCTELTSLPKRLRANPFLAFSVCSHMVNRGQISSLPHPCRPPEEGLC